MKKQYTAFDLGAWAFTGALVMAFLWFCHASYADARQMGYTPDSRAFMNHLAEIYNTDTEIPSEPIALHESDLQ